MRTYTTLDGAVIDIDAFEGPRATFLEAALRHQHDMDWFEFTNMIFSPANPVLAPGQQRGSYNDPLMRVLRDLGDRIGIRSGTVKPEPGDDANRDPFEDELIPMSKAAEELGVSRMAVHKAAKRGELLATDTRPGRVSRRSLEGWRVNPSRQAAGRRRTPRGASSGASRQVMNWIYEMRSFASVRPSAR